MLVLCTRHNEFMRECDAALASLGLESAWQPLEGSHFACGLRVSDADASEAVAALSTALGEELARAPGPAGPDASGSVVWRPAFATGVGLAALTCTLFAVTGDVRDAGPWVRRGALSRSDLHIANAYRLVTATTLHADGGHALTNAGAFLALAWAAGERLGSGMACALWLVTAVAGFAVSVAVGAPGLVVGASGGLFGLLGAATGHALSGALPRRRLEVWGAGISLLAMTAFAPEADRWAHLGGFAAGLVLGRWAPRPRGLGQGLCALATACVVGLAWVAAWRS